MRRRSFAVLLAISGLLVLAIPAAASETFHFSSKGLGAEASWSTSSGSGGNTVYTDTYISASLGTFTENGQTFTDQSVFVDMFSYKFDRRGNFVFVSERFGFASGADADITVDSKLRSASVSATVAFELCDEQSCSPDGTSDVEASWTGTGVLARISQSFHFVSKEFTETGRFKGTFRDATATGSIDGAGVGDLNFADIFNATNRDVSICHHC